MPALSDRLRRRLRPLYRRIAGALPPRARRHFMYTVSVGGRLNLRDPQTFSDKMNWRILHDRRPGIAARCDKMRMKEIAAEGVPDGSLRIPRTLWHGTDVAEVPAELWEGRWVLKPNHGSGDVLFSPRTGSIEELRARTAPWLRDDQSERLGEWGYSQARHELILEELLPGAGVPDDYKFFCFDGVPRAVLVSGDRESGSPWFTFYDDQWRPLDVRAGTAPTRETPRPPRLDDMLAIASRLSQGWDFLRVDLYAIGDEIWFGELTPYSSGGMGHFRPRSYETELGSYWTLPELSPEERA